MPESASSAAPDSPPTPSAATATRPHAPRDRIAALRRLAAIDLPLLATSALLVALTWPIEDLEPGTGLDPSWRTALQMAVHEGLDFGRDVMFTYGPLGFLREPVLAFAWLTRLSFAYALLLQLALCLVLLWALRRNLGSLLLAAPVAFVIAELATEEPVVVIAFAVAVGLVHGQVPTRLAPWLWSAGGALAGVQVLAKLNVGITVLGLGAIALLAAAPRRRAATWFSGGLALALLSGWLLTGQPAAAAWDYVRGALQIITGYSQAMALDDTSRGWELWAALVLVAVGLLVALRGDPHGSRRARIATTALWAVLAFTTFKSGFVRHDAGHGSIFFAAMLGGLAALPLARLPRSTVALALLLAATATFASRGGDPKDIVRPVTQAKALLRQAAVLAVPHTTDAHIVAARARLVAAYALDPLSLARLGGHSVDVEPYETNVAYAYRLRWSPLPVFQSYSAYTPYLDQINAAALSSPAGPQRILRHAVATVDGRNTAWESPAAMRALLCNFRAVSTTPAWQVLARVPNRCGAPRPLGEAHARTGESVAIPSAPPGTALYARIDGVAVSGLERLASTLYRAAQRTATLDLTRSYRLVPGTAADGLLLRVPRDADVPAPFALDQGASEIAVTRAGAGSDDEISLRWYALPVR